MDRADGHDVGALLGVEVIQIGDMLEVVGVQRTVFDHSVRHNIIIVDLNIQRNVLGSQDLLGNLQDLGVRRGGSGHGNGLTLQRVIIRNAAGAETAMKLTSMKTLSLEECLEFIDDDELLEITPKNLRMRKHVLEVEMRKKLAARARRGE